MTQADRPIRIEPAEQRERAAAILAGGTAAPVRPAVSVLLSRQRDAAVEVFLLRRAASMAFMPGRLVFPGGGVDPSDRDCPLLSTSEDVARIAAELGEPDDVAQTLVTTAVRETFEETGVLLGRTADGQRPPGADDVARYRARTLDREMTIRDVLERCELTTSAADLKPWTRWITPPISPIRFDVTFFLAALPAGQSAGEVSTEAQDATWWRPAEVLAAARDGQVDLAYPQRTMLRELDQWPELAAAFEAPRDLTPVRRRPVRIDDDLYLVRE
jgi:8-oxo-dGTP pyrophosphatase MutT (NUDIX family)